MKYFFSLLLFIAFFQLKAQTLRFQETIGDKDAEAHSILKTVGSGYILAGQTWNHQNTDYDVFLVKLDSLGNIIWKNTYGDFLVYEWETDLQKTQDGGYIMTGQSFDLNTFLSNTFILKTDSLGNISWHKSFAGTFKKVITVNNGYLVAGVISSIGKGNNDFYLVKTNLSGNVLWSRTIGEVNDDVLNSIIPLNGGWLLAGETNSFGFGNMDNYFVKTDSLGNILSENVIGDTTEEWAVSTSTTANGNIIVAGHLEYYDALGQKHRAITLLELNSSLSVVWQRKITCSYHADVNKIITTGVDNGFILCGKKQDSDSLPADDLVIKTDSLGHVQWVKTYGGNDEDELFDVIKMPDLGFAVTGTSRSFNQTTSNNVMLIKTDNLGDSYCNSSVSSVSNILHNFNQTNGHAATDTGIIIATNNFPTDTLAGNHFLCSTYNSSLIQEVVSNESVRIYPNPSNGFVNIYSSGNCMIYLNDIFGKLVQKQILEKGNQPLSWQQLENGMYFWNVLNNSGLNISRGKIIIIK